MKKENKLILFKTLWGNIIRLKRLVFHCLVKNDSSGIYDSSLSFCTAAQLCVQITLSDVKESNPSATETILSKFFILSVESVIMLYTKMFMIKL